MKLGKYTSLDRQDLIANFDLYFKGLELPFMDYLAIGVQDTIHKTSASLMSSQDWRKIFRELNLADEDPVRKASFSTRVNHFSFDEVDYQNNAGREVMRQRKLNGIENGLVFMKRSLTHNFMLTMGTGFKNINTYRYLIDYHSNIQKVFNDLIELVVPATKQYQITIPSHPIDDAK
ncbi:MAG: autoinducer binding domain-containing protein [Gammaproteobacteria bacterium]|nr:autoinducer binding domain-containing protein [Gammaproteobacteria bacterium]MCD8542910.1 autoinducer binding domain-containing protein [Gammaproteobacteria bacterium]